MAEYSMWLVEAGMMPAYPRSGMLYGLHNSGTLDVPIGFVVLKGEGHVALVDTGYRVPDYQKDVEALYGVKQSRASDDAIRELGLSPGDVDTIFLTHAHWDHMGNLVAFPNATIYLQAAELERWMWALALPRRFGFLQSAIDPADFQHLFERTLAGQVRLLDGEVRGVLPGIDLMPAHDTHTYGSQFVVITTLNPARPGPWIATGDCVFSYANIEGVDADGTFIPLGHALGSQALVLDTFERIVGIVGSSSGGIVPVHDNEAYARFRSWGSPSGLRIAEITLAPGEPSRVKAAR